MIYEVTTQILPNIKRWQHLTQHFDKSFFIKPILHTEKTGTSPFNWHKNITEAFDDGSSHFITPRLSEIFY